MIQSLNTFLRFTWAISTRTISFPLHPPRTQNTASAVGSLASERELAVDLSNLAPIRSILDPIGSFFHKDPHGFFSAEPCPALSVSVKWMALVFFTHRHATPPWAWIELL